MNHSTKVASLFLFSASTMLALPACMVGAAGTEDESQENKGAPEQSLNQGKGAPEQPVGAEKGSVKGEEDVGQTAQPLGGYGFGYYPPGYSAGSGWYGGAGYYNPGFGYYQPGFGYLPGGYGFNNLYPGYGFYRPGYGYWRPGSGYWRGLGGGRYGWGW